MSIQIQKTISIKGKKLIGSGLYANVYRLSPRRVVKVFHLRDSKTLEKIIKDEIKGSKKMKGGLPILAIVKVELSKYETYGLIKKYVPYTVSYKEMHRAVDEGKISNIWDLHDKNVRKDSKGKFWIIDTQTKEGFL